MSKLLLAALVIALAFGVSSTAQANLLTNPSFESASFTGWTAEWNGPNQAVSSANPQSGSLHARNFYDGGMYQDVAITGGQQYRMTGWAYIPSGGSVSSWGSYIGLKFFDASSTEVGNYQFDMQLLQRGRYNQADTSWVTADSSAVRARVRFGTWQSGGTPATPTDFDNFDLSPIPEPTSLLLLGTGLVGLVGFARKRRI